MPSRRARGDRSAKRQEPANEKRSPVSRLLPALHRSAIRRRRGLLAIVRSILGLPAGRTIRTRRQCNDRHMDLSGLPVPARLGCSSIGQRRLRQSGGCNAESGTNAGHAGGRKNSHLHSFSFSILLFLRHSDPLRSPRASCGFTSVNHRNRPYTSENVDAAPLSLTSLQILNSTAHPLELLTIWKLPLLN